MIPLRKKPLAGGPGGEKNKRRTASKVSTASGDVNPRFVTLTHLDFRKLTINVSLIASVIHSNESDRQQCLTAVQLIGEEKPWLVTESVEEVLEAIKKEEL